MVELCLDDNLVGSKGVAELCRELKTYDSLKILSLRNNGIGENGAKSLATLMKLNRLEEIE